jgi:predicted TIM-barrel fold metal-dependent hydrolase
MTAHPTKTPAQIREELGHPVIDCDGHVLEFMPATQPYVREALGQPLFDQYTASRKPLKAAMAVSTIESRRKTRIPQGGWWGTPVANTRDVATSIFPSLLHERLPELGVDFMILFATNTMNTAGIEHEELRRGLCRGFNDFYADTYGPYADRLTIAGLIPMHTPEEAVAELHHCKEIGLKVVGIPQGVVRPIPEPVLEGGSPWLWPGQRHWYDHFGFESQYDYDPVWQTAQDLGFAVMVHGGLGAPPTTWYTSISSWMFNHIGSFAAMMYPTCKALLLGGVTKRFPELNFGFMECGVGWACTLLSDTYEHWEKRNLQSLMEHYDPSKFERERLVELARQHGGSLIGDLDGDALGDALEGVLLRGVAPEELDEFAALGIDDEHELRDLFVPRFFFGCESDDRTVAFAFSRANVFESKLQAMLSSDISHFDVPDMAEVLPAAHSLLAEGLLDADQFREFAFTHAVKLHAGQNGAFFDGTVLESEARKELGAVATAAR